MIGFQAWIQEALTALTRLYEILSDETIEDNGNIKPDDSQVLLIYDNINFSYTNEKLF